MDAHEADQVVTPRWLHAWAVLTVCATFVLLLLGSLVTTKGAGMADPIWPTYPWHLWLVDWTEPQPGFLIEHSHRLAGYIVGTCTIVLALGLWLREPRRWVRWLGAFTLLGVIVQGLLGGFRVVLDRWLGTDLAVTHGCFAQVVFAMLVLLALATSRGWHHAAPVNDKLVRRLAMAVVGLVYVQIVFGALVRHTFSMSAVRHHLMFAFAVTFGVVWLAREAWRSEDRLVRRGGCVLALVTALQVLMGVEAFMSRFMVRSMEQQIAIRTVHVLLGFLVFAAAVAVAALSWRTPVADGPGSPVSGSPSERETVLAHAGVEGEA